RRAPSWAILERPRRLVERMPPRGLLQITLPQMCCRSCAKYRLPACHRFGISQQRSTLGESARRAAGTGIQPLFAISCFARKPTNDRRAVSIIPAAETADLEG